MPEILRITKKFVAGFRLNDDLSTIILWSAGGIRVQNKIGWTLHVKACKYWHSWQSPQNVLNWAKEPSLHNLGTSLCGGEATCGILQMFITGELPRELHRPPQWVVGYINGVISGARLRGGWWATPLTSPRLSSWGLCRCANTILELSEPLIVRSDEKRDELDVYLLSL